MSFRFQVSSFKLNPTSCILHLASCILITCCLLLTSCASLKVSQHPNGKYISVLQKWTREGKIYDNFETKLIINATYKNKEFRQSYVDEYTKAFMLDGEKPKNLLKDEIEASDTYHEFFIAIHSPVDEWSDLDRKNPMWAIYLTNDTGDRVSPLEIKRIKEKVPGENRFYPYFNNWKKGYTVKFPLLLPDGKAVITDKTRYIKFTITGPLGKGELVWNLLP